MERVFTLAALEGRPLPELQAIFREAQRDLVRSDTGTLARRQALANIDTVSLAIAKAHARPPEP